MSGFDPIASSTGVVGYGEIGNNVRITFTNGIMNTISECIRQSSLLSESHGNVNVHYIHGATNGFCWDLLRATVTKIGGFIPTQSFLMAEKWRALIDEIGGVDSEGLIIHYAHSIGATNTGYARQLLTPKEQAKIRVITFGPATLLSSEGWESATNYISCRDGIRIFDPIGVLKGSFSFTSTNAIFLGSHYEGLPAVDHLFTNENYQKEWQRLGEEFVQEYGLVQ